jgi:hypothetical protein
VAIIAGMLVQVPLVLLVMPALYAWLSGRGHNGPAAQSED